MLKAPHGMNLPIKIFWSYIIIFALSVCNTNTPITTAQSVFVPPTGLLREQINIATTYYINKLYHKAIDLYQVILQKHPDNPLVLYDLAISYYGLREFQNSLKFAEAASRSKSPSLLIFIYY